MLKFLESKLSRLSAGYFVSCSFILVVLAQYVFPFFWSGKWLNKPTYENSLLLISALALVGWIVPLFFLRSFERVPKIFTFSISEKMALMTEIIFWGLFIFSAVRLGGYYAPLFQALRGLSTAEIFESRVNYDLTREGGGLLWVYVQNFVSILIIPFFLLRDLKNKSKWFWFKFALAILVLSLPLAKANALKVFLPILSFLFFSKSYRRMFQVLACAVLHVLILSFLFFGAFSEEKANTEISSRFGMDTATDYGVNFYFGAHGLGGIINRAFWVPYVTGINWIEYAEVEQLGNEKPIVSNRSLALLFGHKYRPIEKEIFSAQFGLPKDMLVGFANTTYYVDAYVKYSIWTFLLTVFLFPMLVIYSAERIPRDYVHLISYFMFFLASNSAFSFLLLGGIIFIVWANVDVRLGSLREDHLQMSTDKGLV